MARSYQTLQQASNFQNNQAANANKRRTLNAQRAAAIERINRLRAAGVEVRHLPSPQVINSYGQSALDTLTQDVQRIVPDGFDNPKQTDPNAPAQPPVAPGQPTPNPNWLPPAQPSQPTPAPAPAPGQPTAAGTPTTQQPQPAAPASPQGQPATPATPPITAGQPVTAAQAAAGAPESGQAPQPGQWRDIGPSPTVAGTPLQIKQAQGLYHAQQYGFASQQEHADAIKAGQVQPRNQQTIVQPAAPGQPQYSVAPPAPADPNAPVPAPGDPNFVGPPQAPAQPAQPAQQEDPLVKAVKNVPFGNGVTVGQNSNVQHTGAGVQVQVQSESGPRWVAVTPNLQQIMSSKTGGQWDNWTPKQRNLFMRGGDPNKEPAATTTAGGKPLYPGGPPVPVAHQGTGPGLVQGDDGKWREIGATTRAMEAANDANGRRYQAQQNNQQVQQTAQNMATPGSDTAKITDQVNRDMGTNVTPQSMLANQTVPVPAAATPNLPTGYDTASSARTAWKNENQPAPGSPNFVGPPQAPAPGVGAPNFVGPTQQPSPAPGSPGFVGPPQAPAPEAGSPNFVGPPTPPPTIAQSVGQQVGGLFNSEHGKDFSANPMAPAQNAETNPIAKNELVQFGQGVSEGYKKKKPLTGY